MILYQVCNFSANPTISFFFYATETEKHFKFWGVFMVQVRVKKPVRDPSHFFLAGEKKVPAQKGAEQKTVLLIFASQY